MQLPDIRRRLVPTPGQWRADSPGREKSAATTRRGARQFGSVRSSTRKSRQPIGAPTSRKSELIRVAGCLVRAGADSPVWVEVPVTTVTVPVCRALPEPDIWNSFP
jgi:hypothetical protein